MVSARQGPRKKNLKQSGRRVSRNHRRKGAGCDAFRQRSRIFATQTKREVDAENDFQICSGPTFRTAKEKASFQSTLPRDRRKEKKLDLRCVRRLSDEGAVQHRAATLAGKICCWLVFRPAPDGIDGKKMTVILDKFNSNARRGNKKVGEAHIPSTSRFVGSKGGEKQEPNDAFFPWGTRIKWRRAAAVAERNREDVFFAVIWPTLKNPHCFKGEGSLSVLKKIQPPSTRDQSELGRRVQASKVR